MPEDETVETLRRHITALLQVYRIDNIVTEESADFSVRELSAIVFLGENGLCPTTALSSILNAPLSTVTSLLDRLVRKKMILRKKSTLDRRSTLIQLAAAGQRIYAQIAQQQYENTKRMLASLDQNEQGSLHHLIGKIHASIAQELSGIRKE